MYTLLQRFRLRAFAGFQGELLEQNRELKRRWPLIHSSFATRVDLQIPLQELFH